MSPRSTQAMTDWAEHFAHVFTDLAHGNADLHNLLDWAYDLYRERGHEDPAQVAHEEFKTARE